MAMDKTTTRRMIGAIVLVLVAALVLAYLLKSKNDTPEVEKVHDVTLPSSPILKFPGDGTASDSATAAQNADQKVGLGVRPDGLKPAGDAVSDAASQAQQTATDGLKTVSGGSSASQGSSTQSTADNKQDTKVDSKPKSDKKPGSRLKEADVLTLDNGSKVSSGKDKSDGDKSQKKSSGDKAKLVGEKKLPKHSDRARRDADKKAAQAKKDAAKKADAKKAAAKKAEAKKKAASADEAPSTGFSVQLLATGSESKAKGVKTQMVAEGYPAYIMSVIKNGKTLYRVRVGSYQDRAEASSVQARMKRRYKQNSNVQNSLVVAN